ncbi:LRR domain containing protein [Trema orientale]|uniref:LRR domain containing protein n=1 Tax=Trema orientale TaxID=63057 RepID=A0A2P5EAQ7_TREOI|nr:LRR domain containing protein [Trema orientale]
MKDLEKLDLEFTKMFGVKEREDDALLEHEVKILEALKPHPDLQSLRIKQFAGATLYPSWMTSLINLRCLTLINCANCKILPPLGKLPYLKSLGIDSMLRLEKVGADFLGITKRDGEEEDDSFISFPKLEKLEFRNSRQWKEWEGSTAATGGSTLKVMPCLRQLKICDCGSLEALPDFLQVTALQHLRIYRCTILREHFQKGKGNEWLNISHIPNIQIDGIYM